jgi:hypothetical protein
MSLHYSDRRMLSLCSLLVTKVAEATPYLYKEKNRRLGVFFEISCLNGKDKNLLTILKEKTRGLSGFVSR